MARCTFILSCCVLLTSACALYNETTGLTPPGRLDDGLDIALPEDVGADAGLLEDMVMEIRNGEWVGIHGILVARSGSVVLEEYFGSHDRDTFHEIRSATKSVGSILAGIAIDQGALQSVQEPVYSYFEAYEPARGWDPRLQRITVRDLLTMTSGFECDDLATAFACEMAMYDSDDWVAYSLHLPVVNEPGTVWTYNSSSLILLGEIVAAEVKEDLHEFAERALFEPLEIDFRWRFSPRGRAWIGGGARMRPRDMMKIGLLMENRGVWKGRRIISEAWIRESTARHQEEGNGSWYAYLWQTGRDYVGEELVTAFWASGNGGQYIIVLPEKDLVVVFTGGNYDSPLAGQPFQMLGRYILPAFLHPDPLPVVDLPPELAREYQGIYEFSFEPSATATVSFEAGRLILVSPDDERIPLVAHSERLFSGNSRYGPLHVEFTRGSSGGIDEVTIYGSFSEFSFRRPPESPQAPAPARGRG